MVIHPLYLLIFSFWGIENGDKKQGQKAWFTICP